MDLVSFLRKNKNVTSVPCQRHSVRVRSPAQWVSAVRCAAHRSDSGTRASGPTPLPPGAECRGADAGGARRGAASGGRTGRLRGRPGARTSSTRPTMVCASLGRSCTPRRARPPRPRRTKRPRPRKPRTPASPRGSRCALPRRVRAVHSRPAPRTARPPRARSVAPLARARALHCGCRALLRARYAAARRR